MKKNDLAIMLSQKTYFEVNSFSKKKLMNKHAKPIFPTKEEAKLFVLKWLWNILYDNVRQTLLMKKFNWHATNTNVWI
jgi:hypothetical protein